MKKSQMTKVQETGRQGQVQGGRGGSSSGWGNHVSSGTTGWFLTLGGMGLIPEMQMPAQKQAANSKSQISSIHWLPSHFNKVHLRKRPLASSRVTAAHTKEKATKLHQPALQDFPWTFQVNASIVYRGRGGGRTRKNTTKKGTTPRQMSQIFIIPGRPLLG